MIWPIYAVYVCIVGLIRVVKWIEYQFLKLFSQNLKHIWSRLNQKLGVVIHRPGEKWNEEDNKRVLAECTRYDKLIHLNVYDDEMFIKWANLGSLGIGETYMDKLWDYTDSPEDLTEFTMRVLGRKMLKQYYIGWNKFLEWLELHAFNLQTRERAFQVGVVHYDLGECECQDLMFENEFIKISLTNFIKFSELSVELSKLRP